MKIKSTIKPIGRKDNLVIQEMDGEILIYDLRDNKAFCLNSTSAMIWNACDGNKSVTELNDFVSRELNTKSNEDMIWLALDQLKKEKLIENSDDVSVPFEGMSRREVVKKIGLGTMIALPLVASLAAPAAIFANSACIPVTNACACQDAGMIGNPCIVTVIPCPQMDCNCYHSNSGGGNKNGNCKP